MYSGVPVIAPNNGGPMESVANAQSGFLIESTSEPHIKWAEKMTYLIEHPDKVR
jgi:glycosyltransferase involved in cell wall biosynthesis